MTKSSFSRGIKKLGYHPYKLIYKYYFELILYVLNINKYLRNKLKPSDFPRRLAMCQHILQKNTDDPTWLPNMWTSDEANFNLNGTMKITNFVF